MRLVLRDIEAADAERKVDRVEIFERPGEIRKVKGEEDEGQNDDQRRTR